MNTSTNPLKAPFEAMGPIVDFEVGLRYRDLDTFGHVNNARLLFSRGGPHRMVRGVRPQAVGFPHAWGFGGPQ